MKKIFVAFFLFFTLFYYSKPIYANEIDNFIKQSDFEEKSTVSVLVEDSKNGEILYKKNTKKLLNPASTLKILTFGASYFVLGEDYRFKTSAYRDKSKNLYIKLGGDVLLTQGDLNNLFSQIKSKVNFNNIENIYIDDSIIDKTPYPSSWMMDDIWPNQRSISPYFINENYTLVRINRSSLSTKVEINQDDDYKYPIINLLKLADKQEIKISQEYGKNSPILTFSGTVLKDETKKIPVLKPEVNFIIKLNNALSKNNIHFLNKIKFKQIPADAYEICYVSHDIKQVSKNILKNSDNIAAEIVFRVAASKYFSKKQASLDDSIKMFNEIYEDFLTPDIKIFDGSGVSRYNLVNSEFMVNSLRFILSKTNNLKELLPTSNEGTLSDRMLFLEGNLRAKTGTLSNMSSLIGIMNTRNKKDVVFSIIIQNSSKRSSVLKNYEDLLTSIIFRKF